MYIGYEYYIGERDFIPLQFSSEVELAQWTVSE